MSKIPQNRALLSLRPMCLAAACVLALAPTVVHAAEPTPTADDAAVGSPDSTVDQIMNATLKLGDPAPALALKKFVKGAPVSAFEKGKVYVVEFWATWCGPCVAAIPHLTALQKEHPEVTFIGVNVGEDEGRVKPFVAKMGDKMNYRVALDDLASVPNGATYKAFTDAADLRSTPTAFIVDKNSKIAWIGYPANLPSVLKQIAAGTPAVDEVADEVADEDAGSDLVRVTEENPDLAWAMEYNPNLAWAMENRPYFPKVMEALITHYPDLADQIMTGEIDPDAIQVGLRKAGK